MHKTRAMQHNEYAQKFFGRMKPGVMGEGFVEVIEEGREGKPKKLFPTVCDLIR